MGTNAMGFTKIENINEYISKSINPAKTPDTIFEMYSVPVFETGHPEYLRGDEIASSKVVVEKDDVLLCKINPRINRVWVVNDESDKQNVASSEWIVVRSKKYNPEYLAWYFRTPRFQKLMTSEVTGIGGSLTRAQPKRVKDYPVPVLDRKDQDAVVDVLNRAKLLVDLRKQELEELDTLIKSRFVEMFGDPATDSMQWGQKPLGEFLKSIRYGTSTPPNFSERGYAFIRATNIKNGHIISKDMKYIDQSEADKIEKCRLQGGEVLVVRSGVNSGDTCVITGEYIGQYAGYDMILEFKDEVNPVFVNEMINTEYMDKVVKPLTRRAAQPHLNSEQVKGLPLIQVPKIRQDEFATFVQQVNKLKFFIINLSQRFTQSVFLSRSRAACN